MPSLPVKKHPLGFFPTPLVPLKKLTAVLNGPQLFIKRDDMTGLALGGNKTRKLEFLVGEALAQGCDTLITGGAAQSNHCRQTAAAAAACGLECHLVLGGRPPDLPDGNLLLDHLFGSSIHWSGKLRKGEQIPEIAQQLEAAGRKPYLVPYGGSDTTGALGFVEAVNELMFQQSTLQQPITHIVFASSSGGTQAGLCVGAQRYGLDARIIGIAIDKGETGDTPFTEQLLQLTNHTAQRLKMPNQLSGDKIDLREEFLGQGYGIVGPNERRAINLLAQTEGILLDPVYTGRAMGGLIQMIEQKEFSANDSVLFWHTGGTPALFPYARQLLSD